MTQATSLTSRWYERPRTIESQGRDHEDKPFWKVEGVTIRIADGDKLELSAPRYGEKSALRVEIADGELRFPLEDLVPLVLERLDIAELSQAICGNEEARRQILDALARYYNEHYIEDADRRFWIAKVQAAIHDRKLDELVRALAPIERALSQTGYDAMRQIAFDNLLRHEVRERMIAAGVDREIAHAAGEDAASRYQPNRQMVDWLPFVNTHGLGAGAWGEARDFWRGQVAAMFPNIEVPEPVEAEAA